jgi:hypothetical protein
MRMSHSYGQLATGIALAVFCARPPAAFAQVKPPAGEADERAVAAAARSPEQPARADARLKELERRVKALSDQIDGERAERLVQEAESEARAAETEERPEERQFLEGGLALQKLNPELTFCGDILAGLVVNNGKFYASESDRSRLAPRAVGLHFQHVLDPYSMFKSAFHFSPDHGVGVEEVYVSWFGVAPSLSLTAGRFRENFGVLNRWHEHDLDQTQHPMALTAVLGDEGLVGNGLSARWFMPRLWAHANELTLDVVDGDNELLFSGEHFSRPSTMLHLKNYFDLTPDTYLELGLTGTLGWNNRRGLAAGGSELIDEPWRKTVLAGADLTVSWQPRARAKYSSFTWRTEAYYARKDLAAETGKRTHKSWGLYSYVQNQLSARWFVGVRGDVALPTERDESNALAWDVVPYVTFWQSEFVYLRLEYQHGRRLPFVTPEGGLGRRNDNRLLLQIDFAAGPHKHEKY